MAKSETQVQREICDYLYGRRLFFWRSNNIPVFGRALPKYTLKGLPDIFIIHGGKCIGFEVKREGSEEEREKSGRKVRAGMLSPEQAEFGVRMENAGAFYFCVRSVQDAEEALNSLFIPYVAK